MGTVVGDANTLFEFGARPKHIFNSHETTIQKFLTSSTNVFGLLLVCQI